VSVYWARPWYQNGIAGVRLSGQRNTLYEFDLNPPAVYIRLKVGYAGRNVPDISMDADPYTGFLVYSTADGGLTAGNGGTSFVAPQLNGIAALINQRVGQRVGLLNAQLYDLLKTYGYGENSPFNDITTGDNWYWLGQGGYDPATGVGTPDAARLAEVLAAQSGQ
jgi:subtilase family serine protease